MSVLSIKNVGMKFGGLTALENVSFSVGEREIFALIGPNGAGKTTLFNVVAGVYRATAGSVSLLGTDVSALKPFELTRRGLTRTFQNLQIFYRMTAAENVMVGRHLHEKRNPLTHLLGMPSVHRQNAATRKKSLELLDFVGLAGVAERSAGELPYGALKRLEIARALAVEPTVLLLDEPVAGCNAVEKEEVASVIRRVCSTGVSILLVEHDMHMVMNLAHRIHVLDQGRSLAEGTPNEIKSNDAVIEAYLGVPKKDEEDADVER